MSDRTTGFTSRWLRLDLDATDAGQARRVWIPAETLVTAVYTIIASPLPAAGMIAVAGYLDGQAVGSTPGAYTSETAPTWYATQTPIAVHVDAAFKGNATVLVHLAPLAS